MAIKCFYHGSDLDGWASGAIVRYFYEKEGIPVEMFPINYGDKFPFESVSLEDFVFMVDFSLPIDDMERLAQRVNGKFIWIDHHASAIKSYNNGLTMLLGIRDVAFAACELTWKYFCDEEMPRFIRLLGLYDRWEHDDPAESWQNIETFQYGFKNYATNPKEKDFLFWNGWFFMDSERVLSTRIRDVMFSGANIKKYVEDRFKSNLAERSFIVDWEGYKCLVINGDPYIANYLTRAKEFEGCDIGINFCNARGEFWIVNLRTTRDDIDLSSLAKKYGGGGHRAAAGFPCKVLPFKEISTGAL